MRSLPPRTGLAGMEVDKENAGPGPGPGPASFSKGQLDQMLGQCLKLASENKITVHNTWSLPLIENLPDLIREEGAEQTNFQRASVTLDAGVKVRGVERGVGMRCACLPGGGVGMLCACHLWCTEMHVGVRLMMHGS